VLGDDCLPQLFPVIACAMFVLSDCSQQFPTVTSYRQQCGSRTSAVWPTCDYATLLRIKHYDMKPYIGPRPTLGDLPHSLAKIAQSLRQPDDLRGRSI
jgi:hypothetical protein